MKKGIFEAEERKVIHKQEVTHWIKTTYNQEIASWVSTGV